MSIVKGYVATRAGQVHYRVSGPRSDRPLVLLHQTASSSEMYAPLMQLMAPRFMLAPDTPGFGNTAPLDAFAPDTPGFGNTAPLDAFAPDTPGFGKTAPLDGEPMIARLAGVLVEALDRLEIGRCDLFGHHSGASLAAQIAHDHPERVARLVLSGPPLLSRAQLERLIPTVTPLELDPEGAHLLSAWRRVRKKDPSAPLSLSQRETVATLIAGPGYADVYRAVFAHDLGGILRELTMPTLLMAGPDDTIVESLAPAASLVPRATLRLLVRGGTYVCDREPGLVAAALTDFFAKESWS